MDAEPAKQLIDVVAVSATASALLGWLPPLAAIATLIWTLIRIFETDTVQRILGRKE